MSSNCDLSIEESLLIKYIRPSLNNIIPINLKVTVFLIFYVFNTLMYFWLILSQESIKVLTCHKRYWLILECNTLGPETRRSSNYHVNKILNIKLFNNDIIYCLSACLHDKSWLISGLSEELANYTFTIKGTHDKQKINIPKFEKTPILCFINQSQVLLFV